MAKDYWKSGSWNVLCDVCGFKRKSTEVQDRWDGLKVCMPSVHPGCWEPRHPQDMIRPIPDSPPIPWSRPEAPDVFVSGSTDPTEDTVAERFLPPGMSDETSINNVGFSMLNTEK